jgi:hypothetical protein
MPETLACLGSADEILETEPLAYVYQHLEDPAWTSFVWVV